MSKGTSNKKSATAVQRGQIDWSRFDALTETEIEAAVRDDPDADADN